MSGSGPVERREPVVLPGAEAACAKLLHILSTSRVLDILPESARVRGGAASRSVCGQPPHACCAHAPAAPRCACVAKARSPCCWCIVSAS
jgi:hypothetical protein